MTKDNIYYIYIFNIIWFYISIIIIHNYLSYIHKKDMYNIYSYCILLYYIICLRNDLVYPSIPVFVLARTSWRHTWFIPRSHILGHCLFGGSNVASSCETIFTTSLEPEQTCCQRRITWVQGGRLFVTSFSLVVCLHPGT